MSTITIPLSDECMNLLQAKAETAGVAVEELVRAALEEWLQRTGPDFDRAANHVLRKNAERLPTQFSKTGRAMSLLGSPANPRAVC